MELVYNIFFSGAFQWGLLIGSGLGATVAGIVTFFRFICQSFVISTGFDG